MNFCKENLEKMNCYSLVVRIIRNVGFEILEKIIDVVYKGSVDVEEKYIWDGLNILVIVDYKL